MMKVHSFDVFDTCLVRSCGNPLLVFDILADRVLGEKADISLKMDFSRERRLGEERARNFLIKGDKEDISLSEIYENCNFQLFTDLTKEKICQIELEIEKDVLLPVCEIKKEIDNLHKLGVNVIFISDMYLPSEYIQKILEESELFITGDSLFVSSNVGRTKKTGHLYEYIRQKMNLEYSQWVHKGDNVHSDYNIPKKLGIKSSVVKHGYSCYEKQLLHKEFSNAHLSISKLASISKAVRLFFENSSYVRFAADFIAPIYVPFVYSVLEDARKRGITQLFFLARDSYIFYIIAKQFRHLFPSISISYLYVSRKSLYLPASEKVTFDNVADMFLSLEKESFESIMDRLHLDASKFQDSNFHNLSGDEILFHLLKNPLFVDDLTNISIEQFNLCLRYFEEQGLSKSNSAIVDLTGTRRCQKCVSRILQRGGYKDVYAYYFETLVTRINEYGYYALNYQDRYDFNKINFHFGVHDIFEQYFSITNQKRTESYKLENDVVVPVFEEDPLDETYKKKVFDINERICSLFAQLYVKSNISMDSAVCSQMALSVYADFCYVPHLDYLLALEDLYVSDSKIGKTKILQSISMLQLLRKRKELWFSGNVMYNCRHFSKLILYLLRLGKNIKEKSIYDLM